jgi:protein-S-isoprenylcysteine O-methyltransferase Ste14
MLIGLVSPIPKLAKPYSDRLDWLWAAVSAGLAIEVIRYPPEMTALLYFSIHALVAVLFLIRWPPLDRSKTKIAYVIAILSTIYIYAFDIESQPDVTQSMFGETLINAGAVLCLFSMLSLGRCFGLLPICRGVQTGGSYRIVRHPIYASYILMDVGLIASYPSIINAVLVLLGLGLFIGRIHYEEQLLQRVDSYREYMVSVKYRVCPYIY